MNFHYFPFKTAVRLPIFVSYRTCFHKLAGGVLIETNVSTGMLLLGYRRLGIQDVCYDRTIWEVDGTIRLRGKRIDLGRGSKICVSGDCTFGDRFTITGRSTIICKKRMMFGINNLISWDVLIMDTDVHKICDINGNKINEDEMIEIKDNVWVGCRATILKGSIIPNNTVIAACAIIKGKMELENCIYTSNRKQLKEGVVWYR